MSAVPKRKLTPAEYLAIERAAEFKSEFYDGVMYPMHGPVRPGDPAAMAGSSYPHSRITANLIAEFNAAFKGGSCFCLTSDTRVKVEDTGLYAYPDVTIVCGRPVFENTDGDVLLNPVIIVEVLSPSTEKYDRGKKSAHYRRIASLREYVLVAQDEPWIDRYVRQADGVWGHVAFDGLAAEFALASAPARVRMADVYAGVEFPAASQPPA